VFALTKGGVFGAPPLTLDGIPSKNMRDTPLDWNADGAISNDLYPTGDDLDNDGAANGNDIPEIYDDWDRPLRFYTWSTGLIRPTGNLTPIYAAFFETTVRPLIPDLLTPAGAVMNYDVYAHPLNQDPDDPTGALSAAMMLPPPNAYFVNPFNLAGLGNPAQPFNESYYHTLDTALVPLIVSAGPDEDLGLFEPDGRDPRDSTVPASFPLRLARPLAEDINASGSLDPGEDLNGDGIMHAPDDLFDNITNRQR
jgi:hypothetical protein